MALWPVWLEHIWAKSATTEGQPGESLAEHTWNVLQRLRESVELRPNLPELVGCPSMWRCLFWACWFHDFGKAASGFQAALREGAYWRHRHEVLSLAFLDWLDGVIPPEDIVWIGAVIAHHHRDPDEVAPRYPITTLASSDQESGLTNLLNEMAPDTVVGLWRWVTECSKQWAEELEFTRHGVTTFPPERTDEIPARFRVSASGKVMSRLREIHRFLRRCETRGGVRALPGVLLRGHMMICDHTASAHVGPSPSLRDVTTARLLQAWGIGEGDLYHHQRSVMEVRGSCVLVAPTGSGKTEAALLWATGNSTGEMSPRVFYTLPYQASMNAMYDRLRACLPGLVGLEHSRSVMALYHRILEDEVDRRSSAKKAKAQAELVRLQHYPLKVLSPYQLLKAAYRLPGYESLLTEFAGASVIFDEVHAYEPQRLAAFLATARLLREALSARLLVMSATVPSVLLGKLQDAVGSDQVVKASPDTIDRFIRHRLAVLHGDMLGADAVQRIAADIRTGKSVLLCCNTVARAKRVSLVVRETLEKQFGSDAPEVILIHGRFNGRDRLAKENQVQEASGLKSTRRRQIVLVATQVVEVSLNIDLDVLYSDPAPLEALLQRFGRVNRNRRIGAAHVHVFSKPVDSSGVYDAGLVQRCVAVLSENDGSLLRDDVVSGWLDSIYSGEIRERWERTYESAYAEFTTACLETLRGFASDRRLEEEFYRMFDSIDVLPACSLEEYRGLLESGEPIEASQLLVPISSGQIRRLVSSGRARTLRHTGTRWVVDVPYDSRSGLQLEEIS